MESRPNGQQVVTSSGSVVVHVCTVQLYKFSQQDSCYLSPTVAGASILQTPHSNSLSAHTYSLLIYSAAKVPICGCTIHPAPSIFPTVPKTYPPVESPFYFVCTAADSAVFKDQQGQLWSIRFPSSAHLEAFVKCILIAQVLLAKDNEDLLLLLGDKQRARKSGSSFFTQVQDLLPVGDNSRASTFGDTVSFHLSCWTKPSSGLFKLPKEAMYCDKRLKLKLRRSKNNPDMLPRGLEGALFGMTVKKPRLVALLVAREKSVPPASLHGRLGVVQEGLYLFKVEVLKVQTEEEKKVIAAENKEKELEARVQMLENYVKQLEDNLEEARETADHLLAKRIEGLSLKELSDLEEVLVASHRKVLEAKIEAKVKDNESRKSECILCYDLKKDLVFVPCGHWCCCSECGAKVSECPLCRVKIQHKVLLFES